MTLHVASVNVSGVLGIREMAVEPGRVTRISGRNGSMKSSLLEAVRMGLGGGNLAKLAHVNDKGKEQAAPEVVIVLKGDREYRVTKKGEKTARVEARVSDSQAFEEVGKPQAWLSSLFDARACNIVQLLKAPDKDLATLILEALPLDLDRAELRTVLGDHAKHVRPVPKGLHALEELAQIREDIFTTRTGVNRDKDSAKKSAEQLRRALPAVLPSDRADEIKALREQRDALRTRIAEDRQKAAAAEEQAIAAARHAHDTAEAEVKASFKQAAAKLRTDHEQQAMEIRAAAERRIAELAAIVETTIDGLRESDGAALEKADDAMTAALQEARIRRGEADNDRLGRESGLLDLERKLTALEAERDEAQRTQALEGQLKKFEQQHVDLTADADRLTATLDALDAFRLQLAKTLPVPGLEIAGSEVKVNGVPWAQLNKGQRVGILVKVACLRAQGMDLPLIFVDDAETLDSEHLALLEQELAAAGVQALISRVSDGDLEVVADGEPAAVGTAR